MGILDPSLKNKLVQQDAAFTDQKQGELDKALDAYKTVQGAPLNVPAQEQAQIAPYEPPSFLQNAAFTGKSFLTGIGQAMSETGEGVKHIGGDIQKGLMYLGENVRGASPQERAQDASAMQSDQWGNEPLNPEIAKALPGGLVNPFNLNKEYIQSGDEGHPLATMAKDFGNLTATIVGSGASGGSTFVLQGIGSGANEVEKMKANGVDFKNGSDEMYIYGKGLINLMLHKSIAGTVLEGKPELTNDVVSSLSADATKELADAAGTATAQDIATAYTTKAATFTEGLQQYGLGIIKKYPIVGAEMALANVANVGLKASVNALNGEDTFKQGGNLSDVPGAIGSAFYGGDPHDTHGDLGKVALGLLNSPAAGFSLLHGMTTAGALIPSSPYKNVVVESLQHDSSTGNVEKIKSQLGDIGAQKGWSEDEIHNTQQTVDALADVAGKIPKDMSQGKFGQAVDIILKRRTLEGVLKEVNAKAPTLDPAFTDKVEPFKDLLNARIEKENDNLSELIKEKKFTYSFKEGKYYKTMAGGEPEEISKDRYDLEKLKTEQPDEAPPVEALPKEAEQPKTAPAAEVPTDEAPKPAAPVAGLDELDNELDSLKQPEAPAPAKPETGIDPNGYQAAAKAEGYKRIDQHPVGSTIDWHGKPMIFVKETSSLAHLKDPESGNTITTNSGNYVKLYDQTNKEETDNAKPNTDENIVSSGKQAKPGINSEAAGNNAAKKSETELSPSTEGTNTVSGDTIEKGQNKQVQSTGKQNSGEKPQGSDVLENTDNNGLPIRASGDNGENSGQTAEKVGARSSQEQERPGQPGGKPDATNGSAAQHAARSGESTGEAELKAEKPYYIAKGSADKPEHEQTKGKPVLPESGLDLFVHEREGDPVDYSVSEGSTGLSIATGDTEQEAIESAKALIEKQTPEGLQKIIDKNYDKGIQSPRGRVHIRKPGRTEAVVAQGTAALREAKAIPGGGNETRAQKAEAIKSIDKAIDEIDKHLEENGRDAETGEPKEPAPEPEPTERDQRKAEREAKKAKVKEKLDAAIKDFTDFGRKHANALINPEYLQKGLKVMKMYAEAGILKFEDIAEDLADSIGEELRGMFDALKASYLAYAAEATDDEVDQMDNIRSVRKIKIEDILTPQENEHNTDNGDDEPPVGPQPTGGVTGGVFDHTNIAGALDWLDKQKAKTGNTMMGMLIPIPPAIWNGAIDVMKGILKATNSTQKAIRVASKYIQDRGGSVAQAKDFEQSMNEKMTNTKAGQLAILPDSEEAHTPEEMLRGAQLIQSRVKLAKNLNPDEQALSNIELTLLNKKELHRYIEIGAVLAVDPQGVLTADVNDFFARVENRLHPKMGTSVPPGVPPVPPTGDGGLPEDEEPIAPRGRIPKANKLPMDPLAEEVEPERNLPDGTKQNYSIWGNLKDIHVRNLEQLKAYGRDISSMDALREAIKLATSRSQSSVDIKLANDKIMRLIGEDGYKVLREALIESRLRGTRERWNNFARQIKVSSDNDIDDLFAAGRKAQMYSIISDLQGYDDDENPALTILTHIDNGEYDDAREYMGDMFSHAGDNVAYYDKLSNGKTFDEMTHKVDGELKFKDDKYQQALDQYKQHIEKPFRESHESNDGIFSDALGPLETYYPLTATGASAHKVYMPSKNKYNAADNINNHFTTGSADQYSSAIADLSRKLAASIKTNNKATFINALAEAGLMAKVSADSPNDGFISINGTPYPATKVPVSDARTIIQNGNVVTIPQRFMLVPTWLYKEIKPIIEGEDDLKGEDHYSITGHVLNASVNLMLGGPAEAISHSHRLLSAITNSMPYMQEWAYKNGILGHAGGLVLNNLFVKKFTGMAKVLFTNASSDEFAADVQEMAKLGLIPEKTWTHTYSSEFARSMGVDPVQFPIPYKDIANGEWKKVFKKGKLFDFSPMLYGKNGFDLKARVVMYRLVKAMNPDATPEQHVKMQGDMGQYTQSLQGRVEKFIKKHGFGPFATFARTYYRAGFKAVTGTTPLPLDAPEFSRLFSGNSEGSNARKFMYYKLAQLISSGVLGYVGYWALAHHAVTGKWPWEDKHSKLGKIPLTESMKHTRFAKKYLYNKRTGAYDDLDMSFFNIPMSRGLRELGIDRAYQVNKLGGTGGQSAEAAQVEAANTMANMYTSSALISIPFTTMTGNAPYLTTLRGYTGKVEPGFLKKVKTAPAGLQIPTNFAAGMMGINPLLESLNPASGAVIDEYNAEDYESGKLMKSIINIAMPGLISPHGNDAKQAGALQKQAKAIQTTIDKEHHKKKK